MVLKFGKLLKYGDGTPVYKYKLLQNFIKMASMILRKVYENIKY